MWFIVVCTLIDNGYASLLLDCEQSLFSSKIRGKETCKRDCERDLRAAMPRAASSVGVGRRVKRETALVSYNDLDARHSGDGVILLVGLRSYDAHLSVTFLRACLHGGGGPQVGEVTRLGGVTRLSI